MILISKIITSTGFVIYGMLHHDIYHLDQLGIIIKLLKEHKA